MPSDISNSEEISQERSTKQERVESKEAFMERPFSGEETRRSGADLIAAIQESPFREIDLEPGREDSPVRDVDL